MKIFAVVTLSLITALSQAAANENAIASDTPLNEQIRVTGASSSSFNQLVVSTDETNKPNIDVAQHIPASAVDTGSNNRATDGMLLLLEE